MDLTMPHLDGVETFRELRRLDPGCRVVLTSGYNEQEAIQDFLGKGLVAFVQKPFLRRDLMAAIQKAVEDLALSGVQRLQKGLDEGFDLGVLQVGSRGDPQSGRAFRHRGRPHRPDIETA